jgi:hypothetical protein
MIRIDVRLDAKIKRDSDSVTTVEPGLSLPLDVAEEDATSSSSGNLYEILSRRLLNHPERKLFETFLRRVAQRVRVLAGMEEEEIDPYPDLESPEREGG